MEKPAFDANEIRKKISELGPWFHNIRINGVKTAPNHFLGDYPRNKWKVFAASIPEDLSGKTVLDIGCNGGFYSIEMKRRGAKRVLGIDSDPDYLNQARFASKALGLDIEFAQMSVYELAGIGERFDLVLFMGVLYHLRYPLLALDIIREHASGGLFVFQSMLRGTDALFLPEEDYPFSEADVFNAPGFPAMHFIEKKYSGDETNWWIPNRSCVEAMLRSSGFEILSRPEKEVYICENAGVNGR